MYNLIFEIELIIADHEFEGSIVLSVKYPLFYEVKLKTLYFFTTNLFVEVSLQ